MSDDSKNIQGDEVHGDKITGDKYEPHFHYATPDAVSKDNLSDEQREALLAAYKIILNAATSNSHVTKDDLSVEECELLKASYDDDGKILAVGREQLSVLFIKAGQRHFPDEIRYTRALKRLLAECMIKLLKQKGNEETYILTKKGERIAETLI